VHLIEHKDWGHYKMKATNNPFISPEEIALQKSLLPELMFLQEWEGEFVDFNELSWFFEYKSDRHLVDHFELDPYEHILLGFDFNVDPGTCLMAQKSDKKGGKVTIFKEIKVQGGTELLCQQVKYELEKMNYKNIVWVTGDSSGNQRSTNSNTTDYEIINQILEIPFDLFKDTRSVNPRLDYSRDICNMVLHNNLIEIVKDECPILVKEMAMARPKDRSSNFIKDREQNKMDSADSYRYINNAFFESIDEIRMYKDLVS